MSDNETVVVLETLVKGRDIQLVELSRQPPHLQADADVSPAAFLAAGNSRNGSMAEYPTRVAGQRDGNRNPGQSGGQSAPTSLPEDSPAASLLSIRTDAGQTIPTSVAEDPAAPPVNLILGVSASTVFKTLIGGIFTAAATLMFDRLRQQGTAPVVSSPSPAVSPASPFELTFFSVCLLLAFAFTIIGACLYTRFRLAAYISGSFTVLLFMLMFFFIMHISLPEKLLWLVWTTGGVLLLACAILFVMDLAGYFKCESRNTADVVEV